MDGQELTTALAQVQATVHLLRWKPNVMGVSISCLNWSALDFDQLRKALLFYGRQNGLRKTRAYRVLEKYDRQDPSKSAELKGLSAESGSCFSSRNNLIQHALPLRSVYDAICIIYTFSCSKMANDTDAQMHFFQLRSILFRVREHLDWSDGPYTVWSDLRHNAFGAVCLRTC
jgi:hypothetical protein